MNNFDSTPERAGQNSKRDWLKWMGGAALAPVLAASGATPAASAARAGPRADYFPNTMVQTHDGKKLRFYDDVVRGKIVVFNMMYSVCTGICPGNTANLLQVQQALGSRLGKDVFMYSMTLQPELDTPRALQDYVNSYHIQPGWTFLTGRPQEMDVIRRKLGFYNDDPKIDADLANHTGMVRIGNESLDRWFMMPALSPSKQIARAILQL
ncbi:SCO family protein [Polaromonas sp.]|uniref:SCO family protein n=1 Tax=Polaromonas sp. TaxID=1869339 RepID=UPI00286AF1F8|nr:SCO family protein [Polaromonas sp.]